MSVITSSYSIPASATPAQIEAQFKQALIDSGLMTSWYDSVDGADGVLWRVLKLTNDEAKTYGSQFIVFIILSGTGGIKMQFATGWNAATHQPTGTQYWDYYELPNYTTYSGMGWWVLGINSGGTTLRRWTRIDQKLSVIITDGGGYPLTIFKGLQTIPSWLDLNYNCAWSVFTNEWLQSGSDGYRAINWLVPFGVRRNWHEGVFHYNTSTSSFARRIYGPAWQFAGATTTATNAYNNGLFLPKNTTAGSPNRPANNFPLVTDINIYPPLDFNMGSDFGLVYIGGVTPTKGVDTVSFGAEQWQIIDMVGGSLYYMAFVARLS